MGGGEREVEGWGSFGRYGAWLRLDVRGSSSGSMNMSRWSELDRL